MEAALMWKPEPDYVPPPVSLSCHPLPSDKLSLPNTEAIRATLGTRESRPPVRVYSQRTPNNRI
jgi:hypothetical protein